MLWHMCLGNSLYASRDICSRNLAHFIRCSCFRFCVTPKSPLHRATKDSLQLHISASQVSSSPDDSCFKNEGEIPHSQLLVGPVKKSKTSTYDKICIHKEDKSFIHRLQVEQNTGPWAHDWTIPFQLLKESYNAQYVGEKEEEKSIPCGQKTPPKARPRIRQKRADQIKTPPIWNAETFASYVEVVCSSSVDRLMQRKLYGGRTTHKEAVAGILERLFEDIGRKGILTPAACEIAMEFFYRNSMIRQARAIFDHTQNLLITIQPSTIDLMLRSTALAKDLHNYSYILRALLRQGFKPTGRTWVALLSAMESRDVRTVILHEMHRIGVLQDRLICKEAVSVVIRDELSSYSPGDFDLATFLTHMDSKYGDQWLSVLAANNLLHELGRTTDVREIVDVLDNLIQRGLVPNMVTFNTLITLCSLQNQHDTVIDIIRRFRHDYHLPLSGIAHRDLFKLAWSRRMYNCARVIWRSACVRSVATYQMQTLAYRSLLAHGHRHRLKNEPQSRGQIWKASAGAVIIGVNPSEQLSLTSNNFFEIPPSSSSSSPSPFAEIDAGPDAPKAELNNPTHSNTISALIQQDLATAGTFRLVGHVEDLLSAALARDREWQRTGVLKTCDTAWKRKNALPIEVKPIFRRQGGDL